MEMCLLCVDKFLLVLNVERHLREYQYQCITFQSLSLLFFTVSGWLSGKRVHLSHSRAWVCVLAGSYQRPS